MSNNGPKHRGRYGEAWALFWGGATVVGICLALLLWSAATVLFLFVVAAVFTALVIVGGHSMSANGASASGLDSGWTVRRAAAAGAAVVAATVVAAVAPLLLWPVVLAAFSTSPRSIEHLRRWWTAKQLTDDRPGDAATDQQLCATWVATYHALQSATDPHVRARIVALRQDCLDELERRNPSALTAWLASGEGPTGSLERFLIPPDR